MFNPFSLGGKTILVTGATSGIGRQCAIDCSKMGVKVILVARNEERLAETLSQMEGEGHKSYCLTSPTWKASKISFQLLSQKVASWMVSFMLQESK